MKNVFFGYMHFHYNSVEGAVKYFNAPTWHCLISMMIKHLVDQECIDAEEYKVSFSNAINFLSDGDKAWATVDGSNKEDDLVNFLDDLSSDNLDMPDTSDGGWFNYSAPGGGIVGEDWLVMTVSFNENFDSEGYDNNYHTIVGKNEESIRKEFIRWAYESFGVGGVHLPNHIEKTIALVNGRYNSEEGGLCMEYRIENLTGKKISGENII